MLETLNTQERKTGLTSQVRDPAKTRSLPRFCWPAECWVFLIWIYSTWYLCILLTCCWRISSCPAISCCPYSSRFDGNAAVGDTDSIPARPELCVLPLVWKVNVPNTGPIVFEDMNHLKEKVPLLVIAKHSRTHSKMYIKKLVKSKERDVETCARIHWMGNGKRGNGRVFSQFWHTTDTSTRIDICSKPCYLLE